MPVLPLGCCTCSLDAASNHHVIVMRMSVILQRQHLLGDMFMVETLGWDGMYPAVHRPWSKRVTGPRNSLEGSLHQDPQVHLRGGAQVHRDGSLPS